MNNHEKELYFEDYRQCVEKMDEYQQKHEKAVNAGHPEAAATFKKLFYAQGLTAIAILKEIEALRLSRGIKTPVVSGTTIGEIEKSFFAIMEKDDAVST